MFHTKNYGILVRYALVTAAALRGGGENPCHVSTGSFNLRRLYVGKKRGGIGEGVVVGEGVVSEAPWWASQRVNDGAQSAAAAATPARTATVALVLQAASLSSRWLPGH